ncbi:MAG TPA: biotin transporter BioY [Ruminococcus sp.]|nr:biotin transporter BioY [Ruminococcus sp.]
MEQTIRANKHFRTIDLTYIAIGAALIAVCSWISIPMSVPFTLQTFAVFFLLMLLGGKRGTCAVLVYILLGAAGVPVFSGFSSGIGVLLGSTGGYILGFLLTGLIYLGCTKLFGEKLPVMLTALVLGLAVCYTFGTAWFLVVYNRANDAIGIGKALSWCVIPFLIPDLVKMALACLLANRIKPFLSKSGIAADTH